MKAVVRRSGATLSQTVLQQREPPQSRPTEGQRERREFFPSLHDDIAPHTDRPPSNRRYRVCYVIIIMTAELTRGNAENQNVLHSIPHLSHFRSTIHEWLMSHSLLTSSIKCSLFVTVKRVGGWS